MRVLGLLAWAILAAGTIVGGVWAIAARGEVPRGAVIACSVGFLAVLVVREIASVVDARGRRGVRTLAAAAIVLWIAGAMVVNGAPTTFPDPGEILFLAAYLAFAVYIVADARRRGPGVPRVLDAVVVATSAAALVAALAFSRVGVALADDALAAGAALIYPVLDICLVLLIGGQWALDVRRPDRRSITLMAGFTVMALADVALTLVLAGPQPYSYGLVSVLLWGVALLLISDAACTPRRLPPPHDRRLPPWVLVGAAGTASLLLATTGQGWAQWAVAVPALAAVLATVARLALALREATAATAEAKQSAIDDLTDLPNRRGLLKELTRRGHEGTPHGMLLLDLDNFGHIKEVQGVAVGDTLLAHTATRIQAILPTGTTVARVGGGDFAAVVAEDDVLTLLELAQELRSSLLHDTTVGGVRIALQTTVGIAVAGAGDSPSTLLTHADAALTDARRTGAGALLYDASSDDLAAGRQALADDLRAALLGGGLEVVYEPRVDARTGELVDVTAQPAWHSATHGRVPLVSLLSAVRRAGASHDLVLAIATQVATDRVTWQAAGLDIPVTLAVEAPEMLGGILLPALYRVLADTATAGSAITVACGEDLLAEQPERGRQALGDLRSHGLRSALLGLTSAGQLRDLPLDDVTFARSVSAGIDTDSTNQLIAAATLTVARALGMRTILTGVDTASQARVAGEIGADVVAGVALAMPMSASDLVAWAQGRRSWTALRLVPNA